MSNFGGEEAYATLVDTLANVPAEFQAAVVNAYVARHSLAQSDVAGLLLCDRVITPEVVGSLNAARAEASTAEPRAASDGAAAAPASKPSSVPPPAVPPPRVSQHRPAAGPA